MVQGYTQLRFFNDDFQPASAFEPAWVPNRTQITENNVNATVELKIQDCK
jgi:hypothetical protein